MAFSESTQPTDLAICFSSLTSPVVNSPTDTPALQMDLDTLDRQLQC